MNIIPVLALIILTAVSQLAAAENLNIATASNFSVPLKKIARLFEQQTGHKVTIISASTGKLYAQIIHGAPFNAFFSADSRRPELLEKEQLAVADSRFTYAIGRLVLWSPDAAYIDKDGMILKNKMLLQDKQFRYLAMANAKLAPYGRAAEQTLSRLKLLTALRGKIVRGENIGQTFQFVRSHNAQLGLLAYSQIIQADDSISGSYWLVPQSYYTPIKQQAVLLKANKASRQFYDFVKSAAAGEIIKNSGYQLDTAGETVMEAVNHAQ